MAEGAKRVRDKETGKVLNFMPDAYVDPTKYEELSTSPAYVMAPAPESPIVTNALNQGLDVSKTPPAPAPLPAPEPIIPAAGPAIAMPPSAGIDVSTLPPAEEGMQPVGLPEAPGGLTPKSIQTTTTTVAGTKASKKTMAEIAAADKDLAAAAQEGTRLAVARAAEDETLARQKQLLAEQKAEADAEFESRRAARVETARNAIAEKVKAAEAAKVDPGRFFAEKGTMGKIGAAFAVALGAYAGAYTGQENYALRIINDAIERDILAQREDKDTKNQAVLQARAEFDDLRTTLGDEKLAKDAIHIQKLSAVANSWEANVAKLGSAEAKQKGQAALAQLRSEIATRTAAFEKDAQDKVQSTTVVSLEPSMPKGAMGEKDLDRAMTLSQRYEQDQQTKDGRTMLSDAGRVKSLVDSARSGNVEASAALKGLWARYVNGPGVLTQQDFERAKLAGGVWESASAKISKGLYGELTDVELQAAARVKQLFEVAGNRLLAQSAKRYVNFSKSYGVPVDMVVADPNERTLAMQPDKVDSEERAMQLGLNKSGDKKNVAVAKK